MGRDAVEVHRADGLELVEAEDLLVDGVVLARAQRSDRAAIDVGTGNRGDRERIGAPCVARAVDELLAASVLGAGELRPRARLERAEKNAKKK